MLVVVAATTLCLVCLAPPAFSASYGPSFVQEPPAHVLYSNNSGLVLDCVARGEPPPIVDWVDDAGHVLPLMPSVARRLHNGSLHFLPFARSPPPPSGLAGVSGGGLRSAAHQQQHHGGGGGGEYAVRCRASNAYGRVVSKLVKVKPGT